MKYSLRSIFTILLLAACTVPRTSTPPTATNIPPTTPPEATDTSVPTSTPTEVPVREDTVAILERLGGEPCPDSEFTCVTLTVPLDHFDPSNPETIQVVFGVLPASGERKGMFVTATGGPGYSGLSAADDYTDAFDPSIPEHFDVVFFDQRGIGESGGFQCVKAAMAFYQADWRTLTPEQESAFLQTSRTFAQDCLSEMDFPIDKLPFYSTREAVEDLEAFRQAIGDEQFWLYGESYGTQFAQTYAAAHPKNLAGLILDGTVDLTLSGADFLVGQAQAFNEVLVDILKECNKDEACAADMGGDALAFFDDLYAEIATSPVKVIFPLPNGGTKERSFTFSDLEYVVSSEMYAEGQRLILMRALAAAQRGDLVPLTRLLYVDLNLDPATLEPTPDPDYSDAVYYTVECNDYSYFSGSPEQRGEAYLRAGDALDESLPYLNSIFYGDMPCVFWPTKGEAERPSPLRAAGIPTLVLGATADPVTPVENGESAYHRLADGYLITTQGGAHIIFGRGDACPDEIVTDFLVNDQMPEERTTTCEGMIIDSYVPLAPLDAADFADPLAAMISVDNEIYYLPEYYYWDLETPTSVGCPFGGTMQFEATEAGDQFSLSDCAFSRGFILTGKGGNDFDAGLFTLEIDVSGRGTGTLSYLRDDNQGTYTLTGVYNGQPVELTQ